ncbi:hypothetical protein ACIA8C_04030 [Nocardia sp. NPDC051321]|uniref:hypothetical protein n=1 Tax=Nocardia sp. NPDC051321 TaxID=3364323 RepID=UPI0037BB3E04
MSDASSSGKNAAPWGAVAAVVVVPPAAAIVAAVYQFPVFMYGEARGLSEADNAAMGSLFYLLFGGGPIMALLGAAAGGFVSRHTRPGIHRARVGALIAGAAVALLAAMTVGIASGLG